MHALLKTATPSTSLRAAISVDLNWINGNNNKCSLVAMRRRYASTVSSSNSNSNTGLKQTCLYEFHKDLKARMETFAGYSMPIVYKGQSIKSEHLQTRHSAAAFDVSHMMQTIIRGRDRIQFIEALTTADVQSLGLNKCSLSVFTNDRGGIIDDCIIGKCIEHLQIVSNAGNADTLWSWMNDFHKQHKSALDVDLVRLDGQGLIALQGPQAANVLQQIIVDNVKLEQHEFMTTFEAQLRQIGTCQITRCGYTGEDGFEISVNAEASMELMKLLCNNDLVKPAGLGARDTLRLEASLCLHGHDIDDETTPVDAALTWVVHKNRRQATRANFPGASKIIGQIKNGSKVKRIGLVAKSQGGPPARESSEVVDETDKILGKVTSGNFAPMLDRNIAMAYLPSEMMKQQGKTVFCIVRGKKLEYEITKMPFVQTNYYIL